MEKKEITFITTGYFPIPPILGGAVENLIYSLVLENEVYRNFNFVIYSVENKKAEEEIVNLKNTKINFIKIPNIIKKIDKLIYWIATNILRIEKNLSFRYIVQRLWYEYKVALELDKKNYDKIIIENIPMLFLIFKYRKNMKKYEDKIYFHIHNEIGIKISCKKEIMKSKAIIGVSDFIIQKFKEKFTSYSGKTYVLKNCVIQNKKIVFKEDIREKYGISKKDFLILFVGRLSKEKGVKELLEAYTKLNIPDTHLLIVGGNYYGSNVKSHYEQELYELARKTDKKITFTGYQDFEKINSFYSESDLAVFPAMWNEPAGLTIIEAMAKGVPIITTNVGGIQEYVGKDNVILLEKNEFIIEKIKESILYIYNNKNKVKEKALLTREIAKSYNEKKYYEDFTKIIEE